MASLRCLSRWQKADRVTLAESDQSHILTALQVRPEEKCSHLQAGRAAGQACPSYLPAAASETARLGDLLPGSCWSPRSCSPTGDDGSSSQDYLRGLSAAFPATLLSSLLGTAPLSISQFSILPRVGLKCGDSFTPAGCPPGHEPWA